MFLILSQIYSIEMFACHLLWFLWKSKQFKLQFFLLAQSAGAVEYTDCISIEG